MKNFEIYNDIAERTSGDIYIGVVGPVRTGKSTFISRFMQTSILDNIVNANDKKRAVDEMPQSGAGKLVMTMQPKFVPNEAVSVKFENGTTANVRLVDCVGYPISGVDGFLDGESPRMVKTPWNEKEIPFEDAAEIGTKKVIVEHSTIAVLVTTDGSIAGIDRENYEAAEERVVAELKNSNKPFIVVLNSTNPDGENAKNLAQKLQEKYGVAVVRSDVSKLDAKEIENIIEAVLMEFPVTEIRFNLPKWIRSLSYADDFIFDLMQVVKAQTKDIVKMKDYAKLIEMFDGNEDFEKLVVSSLDMSKGVITFDIPVSEKLYYKTLSKTCGMEIEDDFYLMSCLKELVSAKKEYDKIKVALDGAKETGYGVVVPTLEELELMEPEIVTKGTNSSLKLKAKASSLHIIKVDVESEIAPAVGNAAQGGSLVSYMLKELEDNKADIWNKNMFGKPMNELVKDTIDGKLAGLPEEVQVKMRKTLTKIVNERKGGVICILL